MSDTPLQRLSAALDDRYRVERELGEGGMATVYLAEDLKHKRQVAIKVLKPELAAIVGAERFLAEIETTANLQHPHILPLFDSGQADSFLYYVMPYVEGPTLREHLAEKGQLPLDEALTVARKVASALSYAHEEGVVHRDVKPANILVSRGEPLVADFGIALALSEAGGGRITETGLSMGTPHYMSPEQASGERTLDRRTDVYALGCVLYEMLTGQPPFPGPNAQAVLGRILTGEPTPPSELRRTVPTHVDHALSKALERVPADRFATADAFVAALDDPSFRHGLDARGRRVVAGPGAWRTGALAAGALALVLAALLGLEAVRGGSDGATVRQRVNLWEVEEGVPPWLLSRMTALAPNGHAIVYPDTIEGGVPKLFYKAGDEARGVPLPGAENAWTPAFSPDGAWIAYVTADGELRKQPVTGGTSVLVADSAGGGTVAALDWLDDWTLVYEAADFTIRRIDDDGTDEEILATRAQVGGSFEIAGLVGSEGVLVVGCPTAACPPGVSRLSLVHFARDTAVTLSEEVTAAAHLPGDRVVYVDPRGAAYLAYLDLDALTLSPPTPLFDGVATNDGAAEFVLSRNGDLLYRSGGYEGGRFQVSRLDDSGRPTPVEPGWTLEALTNLDVSPDGSRLALSLVDEDGADQIWIKELPEGPLTPLTFGPDEHLRPRWIDGGSAVAFVTLPTDTAVDAVRFAGRIVADGSARTVDTVATHPRGVYEVLQAPGGWVLRVGTTDEGDADILFLADGSDEPVPLLDSRFNESSPRLSPDGRWMAYVSSRSGDPEVYVRPFPGEGPRRQVSSGGGREPLWTPDGGLLYTSADSVHRANVDPGTGAVRAREFLFPRGLWALNSSYPRSTVDPATGDMLVQAAPQETGLPRSRLIYVQNLLAEIRALEEGR